MTTVYFIRHAEPNHDWAEDRTRPLTRTGMKDSIRLVKVMKDISIDAFYCSPYLRSQDTIQPIASARGMVPLIQTREDLREREAGEKGNVRELFIKRWSDFSYAEPGGESLGDCQKRNIACLKQILEEEKDKTIVIGTHGTALSTIINYYEPSYQVEDFYHMINFQPYVVKMEFDGDTYQGRTSVYKNDKTLHRKLQRGLKRLKKRWR